MHYWCVFEVVVWLIGLSKPKWQVILVYVQNIIQGGSWEKVWHFRANIRFLNIRVALDFKSTPLKTFLKNLDLPQSYDCFRNTKSAWVFTGSLELTMFLQLLLAPYLRPPSNPLLRILPFLLLWPNARGNVSLCQCTGALSPLKLNPNWKRLMWMTDVPRKLTVTTRAIISFAPL